MRLGSQCGGGLSKHSTSAVTRTGSKGRRRIRNCDFYPVLVEFHPFKI